MPTKLAPEKQRQQFLTKVAALLLDLGATPGDYDFALQTKAGLLKLHPTENKWPDWARSSPGLKTRKRPGNCGVQSIYGQMESLFLFGDRGSGPGGPSPINCAKCWDSSWPRFQAGGSVLSKRKPIGNEEVRYFDIAWDTNEDDASDLPDEWRC